MNLYLQTFLNTFISSTSTDICWSWTKFDRFRSVSSFTASSFALCSAWRARSRSLSISAACLETMPSYAPVKNTEGDVIVCGFACSGSLEGLTFVGGTLYWGEPSKAKGGKSIGPEQHTSTTELNLRGPKSGFYAVLRIKIRGWFVFLTIRHPPIPCQITQYKTSSSPILF